MKVPLTYRDVRKVLALVDGWKSGRAHLEVGDLVIDAITSSGGEALGANTQILSPAVGAFNPEPILVSSNGRDTVLAAGTSLGHVVSPLRSTPIVSNKEGRLISVLVSSGEFVEYGQPIIEVESLEPR